ncbi:hypothetical protein [Pantoea agglomerans]|uniref:hypothetical protein n=1 Tax=Enterobacter agglomerans TaxID=549 RepID=UPI000F037425|nr:hypothetical protein [Pantoea agglomerans]AYP25792.1 hypothetical protein D0A61_23070 [Pantoea agglomerans]
MLTFNGACLVYPFFRPQRVYYGTLLVKFLMTQSSFCAWDLAMRTTQGDMMPAGGVTALLVLSVLAAGSLLATASLFIWHAVPELAVRPDRLRRTPQLQN